MENDGNDPPCPAFQAGADPSQLDLRVSRFRSRGSGSPCDDVKHRVSIGENLARPDRENRGSHLGLNLLHVWILGVEPSLSGTQSRWIPVFLNPVGVAAS